VSWFRELPRSGDALSDQMARLLPRCLHLGLAKQVHEKIGTGSFSTGENAPVEFVLYLRCSMCGREAVDEFRDAMHK
jgi:hypothetical protein